MENCSSIAFSSTAFSISFTSSSEVISVTESCASAGSAPASAVTLTVVFPTTWLHVSCWFSASACVASSSGGKNK